MLAVIAPAAHPLFLGADISGIGLGVGGEVCKYIQPQTRYKHAQAPKTACHEWRRLAPCALSTEIARTRCRLRQLPGGRTWKVGGQARLRVRVSRCRQNRRGWHASRNAGSEHIASGPIVIPPVALIAAATARGEIRAQSSHSYTQRRPRHSGSGVESSRRVVEYFGTDRILE